MASYLSTSLIEIHNASANHSPYIGSALNSSQHGMSLFGWANLSWIWTELFRNANYTIFIFKMKITIFQSAAIKNNVWI